MAAHCITTISHGLPKPRLTLSGLSIAAGKSHFTAAATTPDHHHSAIHELLCLNQSTSVLCTMPLITSTTTSIAATADSKHPDQPCISYPAPSPINRTTTPITWNCSCNFQFTISHHNHSQQYKPSHRRELHKARCLAKSQPCEPRRHYSLRSLSLVPSLQLQLRRSHLSRASSPCTPSVEPIINDGIIPIRAGLPPPNLGRIDLFTGRTAWSRRCLASRLSSLRRDLQCQRPLPHVSAEKK
ncbi:hypothetical protein M0R45_007509 [Rubus argutus]|uniref:Uncharacterized protein n=1 Tax=Rubus argutus TaxID=59490 RepID=A0AAW1Y0H9_RUBAR